MFTVEPAAITLDADVKLRVLDQALEMIDPRAKPKPQARTIDEAIEHRFRSVAIRDAVKQLQRALSLTVDGTVGTSTLKAVQDLYNQTE